MNMIGIKCPHCGADLKINDEIDMFYCNFCGGQIFMNGLSDAAYESRTKIKGMKHEEVMLDKQYEHEKYLMESQRAGEIKDVKIALVLIAFFSIIALLAIYFVF